MDIREGKEEAQVSQPEARFTVIRARLLLDEKITADEKQGAANLFTQVNFLKHLLRFAAYHDEEQKPGRCGADGSSSCKSLSTKGHSNSLGNYYGKSRGTLA